MSILPFEQIETQADVWKEIRRVFRKRWFLVALVTLVTVLAVYGLLQLMTERYEAETQLLVTLGRENTEAPPTAGKGMIYTTGVRREEINSNIEMLRSRPLIEATVDKIGVEAFALELPKPVTRLQAVKYHIKRTARWTKQQAREILIWLNIRKRLTEREKVIRLVQDALIVEHAKDSDLIIVRLRLPDPALAVRTVNTLVQFFLDKHFEIRRVAQVVSFFDQQVNDMKKELDTIDAERQALRSQANVSSIENQRKLLLERLHDLYAKIDYAEAERTLLTQGRPVAPAKPDAAADKAVAPLALATDVVPNPSVASVKEKISSLQIERAGLLASHAPDNQVVKKVDVQIERLESMLLHGLEISIAQLKEQAAAIQKQLDALNAVEDRLAMLERRRTVAEQNYYTYSSRREDARINEELNQSRVANVIPLGGAQQSLEPVYPRKVLIMAISIPLGLFVGIVLGLLREYFDDRIERREDLLGLDGIAYLGTFRALPAGQIGILHGGPRS